MAGPPMNPDDARFTPIIMIVGGIGGHGKSTLCNILSKNSKDIYWLQTDYFCSKYTGPTKICTINEQTEVIKKQLLNDIINHLTEIITKKEHKIIIVEGFCCDVIEIKDNIPTNLYAWGVSRI